MWGLPQKQNARRAYKIRLCGHLRRYKKIVKRIYIISINLYKFFDSWTKWKRVFVLYVKMKCSFLGILKCCMGFLFFLVEIHLVYLYNTYRERLLEKQWLLWNKINAEALIFFHCRWWLVLFAFFYNHQCYF